MLPRKPLWYIKKRIGQDVNLFFKNFLLHSSQITRTSLDFEVPPKRLAPHNGNLPKITNLPKQAGGGTMNFKLFITSYSYESLKTI